MNTIGAAAGGIGSMVVGLALLAYQLGRWGGGGEYYSKVHFVMGIVMAALLFLGGGVLGAAGGTTAALGDGVGRFALEGAVDVAAGGGGAKPTTGGEKVGVGGAALGLCILAYYIGMVRLGRPDLKGPVIRGSLTGIFLGGGAGLIGMAIGVIQTSGNSAGGVLMGLF